MDNIKRIFSEFEKRFIDVNIKLEFYVLSLNGSYDEILFEWE